MNDLIDSRLKFEIKNWNKMASSIIWINPKMHVTSLERPKILMKYLFLIQSNVEQANTSL